MPKKFPDLERNEIHHEDCRCDICDPPPLEDTPAPPRTDEEGAWPFPDPDCELPVSSQADEGEKQCPLEYEKCKEWDCSLFLGNKSNNRCLLQKKVADLQAKLAEKEQEIFQHNIKCTTVSCCEGCVDLKAKLAEYEEHTGTLGRSLKLLKENIELKEKLAEKEKESLALGQMKCPGDDNCVIVKSLEGDVWSESKRIEELEWRCKNFYDNCPKCNDQCDRIGTHELTDALEEAEVKLTKAKEVIDAARMSIPQSPILYKALQEHDAKEKVEKKDG